MKLFINNRITLWICLSIAGSCYANSSDNDRQSTVEHLNRVFLETCRNKSFFEDFKTYLDLNKAAHIDKTYDCQPALWNAKVFTTIIDPNYEAQKLQDANFRDLQATIRKEAKWNSDTMPSNVRTPDQPTISLSGQRTESKQYMGPKLKTIQGFSNLGISTENQR